MILLYTQTGIFGFHKGYNMALIIMDMHPADNHASIVRLPHGEYPGEKRSTYLDIFRLALLKFGMSNNDAFDAYVGVAGWLPGFHYL